MEEEFSIKDYEINFFDNVNINKDIELKSILLNLILFNNKN